MSEEIIESAKAVQEVAKVTGKAIQTTERIGNFFSRVMNESIEATCGMLSDTLKYKRWERQIKLIDKAEALIVEKGLSQNMRPIKPKLALPILHSASLEDNEVLHDIWVQLLVSALDPNCVEPRNAFVSIIQQLEPVDVQVLNIIFENYVHKLEDTKMQHRKGINSSIRRIDRPISERQRLEMLKDSDIGVDNYSPTFFSCHQGVILSKLHIDKPTFRTSIDNLIRQRLTSSYLEYVVIGGENEEYNDEKEISVDQGYSVVCLTDLGHSFVKACLPIK